MNIELFSALKILYMRDTLQRQYVDNQIDIIPINKDILHEER